MADLQFPQMGGGGQDVDMETILRLLGLGQPPPQPQGFGGRLKAALPQMIQGGIDAASTPNIGFGGPIDVMRSLQTSRAMGTARDLTQRNLNSKKAEDLLKVLEYKRQARLEEERQRHDMATEDASRAINERVTNANELRDNNTYSQNMIQDMGKGLRLLRPLKKTLTPGPLDPSAEPPGPPNPDPGVDTLPPSSLQPMQTQAPEMTASPEMQMNPGEMQVPSITGPNRDPEGSIRVMPTQEEMLRRATQAATDKVQEDWPEPTPQMVERFPNLKGRKKISPTEYIQASTTLRQEEKPEATPKGGDAPLSKAEADNLNASWAPVLKKYGLPTNQFQEGMSRTVAADLVRTHNATVSNALGGQRASATEGKTKDTQTHQEYMAAVKDVEKDFSTYKKQIDTLDQARAELSRGDAAGQAVGVVKYLSTLASGQGSGVRITQAELNQVIKARSLGDDFRAWVGKFTEGKILAPAEVSAMQGVLDDVERIATKKQSVLDDAIGKLDAATSVAEVRKAKADLRHSYMAEGSGVTSPIVNKLIDRYKAGAK